MKSSRNQTSVFLVIGWALPCCTTAGAAASVVEYRVTFDSIWSQETHPQDFPTGFPHYSGLIGGTHNASITFWQEGGLASNGMELMAELGSKSGLTDEVNAAMGAGTAWSLLSGDGLGPSPGTISYSFTVSDTHSLVTLVAMIAPSPDWFVGVSGLNLKDANGFWEPEVVVELHPYDAGTDNGVTYVSPDDDAQPPDPITEISDTFPFTGTPPLGTFTFELISPPIPAMGAGGLVVTVVLLIAAGIFILRRQDGGFTNHKSGPG